MGKEEKALRQAMRNSATEAVRRARQTVCDQIAREALRIVRKDAVSWFNYEDLSVFGEWCRVHDVADDNPLRETIVRAAYLREAEEAVREVMKQE